MSDEKNMKYHRVTVTFQAEFETELLAEDHKEAVECVLEDLVRKNLHRVKILTSKSEVFKPLHYLEYEGEFPQEYVTHWVKP